MCWFAFPMCLASGYTLMVDPELEMDTIDAVTYTPWVHLYRRARYSMHPVCQHMKLCLGSVDQIFYVEQLGFCTNVILE